MKLTNLGIILRDIRIKNKELLYDMAKNINVSAAHLSHIEQGIKKLTWEQFYILVDKYKNFLDNDNIHKIYNCIDKNIDNQFKILITECNNLFKENKNMFRKVLYYNGHKINVYKSTFINTWYIHPNNKLYKSIDELLNTDYNNLLRISVPAKMCNIICLLFEQEKEIFNEGVFVG
jgi:transcriptional regulator with XRE-family HTH domain